MSIQKVGGGDLHGKLCIQWFDLDPTTTDRISIQIAKDALFSETYRHYILPKTATSVGLAVDKGPWFFRVGLWKNTSKDVDWSGIFGPLQITTERVMLPLEKNTLKILHTQPLAEGLRIHTGQLRDYSVLLEITTKSLFTPSTTKYKWIRDNLMNGYFDIMGLDKYNSYTIRFTEIKESETAIVEAKEWLLIKNQKPLPPIRHHSNQDRTSNIIGKALLDEARVKPPRFSSGTDYAMYVAAREKAKGGLFRQG